MTALPNDAQRVLDFWFGPPSDPQHHQPREMWFRKDAAFDAQVAQRFGALIDQALAGTLDGWAAEPLPALARVVVLDQFTRNTRRGRADAFAGDPQALAAAQAIVAAGWDRGYTGVQRQFAYLPFEHAEDMAMQQRSMQLFTQLAADVPALADLPRWAQAHLDIVARFGRFPHRNAALGRTSTAAEQAFLLQPGSSF